MDAREAGRRAARRWTGLLSALGIGLTGVLGFATYHAIEADKTVPASTSTTDDGSTGSGDSTAPDQGFSQDDGSAPQDDGNGFSQGFGPGSGPGQTGSSGS